MSRSLRNVAPVAKTWALQLTQLRRNSGCCFASVHRRATFISLVSRKLCLRKWRRLARALSLPLSLTRKLDSRIGWHKALGHGRRGLSRVERMRQGCAGDLGDEP